jgi:hypothetical protein
VHAKNGSRSIKYLLSANPKLQRISLKKLTARVMVPKKSSRAARSKDTAHWKKSVWFPWTINAGAAGLAVICVMAAAALIAARQPTFPTDLPAAIDTGSPELTPPAAPSTPRKLAVAKAPAPVAVAKPQPPAPPSIVDTPAVEPVKSAAMPMVASAAVPEPAPAAAEAKAAPITVTGCLAQNDDEFFLKDASGDNLPKSRSWKSGFLKKRAASIEILDAAHNLKLKSYVGQRVTATGVVVDGEMRARSVKRVSSSCS